MDEDTRSSCCDAFLTYLDDGDGNWILCCRYCYGEVYLDGTARGE